ncbi:MAG TPA: hypothetical protein VF272_02750, partial [Candidatus Saccharimonadia bacterium]
QGVFLFSLLAALVFAVGLPLLALAIADKKQLSIAQLFTFDKRWLYMVATYLLIIVPIFLGLLLFIVPGIILAIMWGLAFYIIADKVVTPIEALKESARLTKGYRTRIFLLGLVVAVLAIISSILAILPFIGFIAASMLSTIFAGMYAVVYRKLQVVKGAGSAPSAGAPAVASV